MAALPPRDQRHLWLRYEGQEYTDADIVDLEERLGRIYDRRVHRVHTFDFGGLTAEVDLGFQLGKVRHRMSLRHYILAMGFHRAEELDSDGIVPYYTLIRNPLIRLCHRLIAFSIAGRIPEPEKVTLIDLFYLRSIDMGLMTIPYLLAQYLRRYASGRKRGSQMSRGHFVARLGDHFGLLTKERLQGLTVVVCDLIVIDMDELARLRICERLHLQLLPLLGPCHKGRQGLKRSFMDYERAWESSVRVTYTSYIDYQISYQRHTRWRTGEASTSAAPHIDDQPDP
ncbi:hypothetical protein Tco_1297335 [Tanacetum coccineum]